MPLNALPAPLFLSGSAFREPRQMLAGEGWQPQEGRNWAWDRSLDSRKFSTGWDFQMARFIDRRSKSLWMDVAVAPDAAPLQGDSECDVVIVGAGIAGISTAYELATEGSHVVVVDRGKIAGGITARTSAHL